MEKYNLVNTSHAADEPIAAIDIGTNSAHLVVAIVLPSGSLKILDTEKVALRLGQALDKNRRLSKEAITRTVATMKSMQEISSSYTTRLRAVATHATREAVNYDELLSAIYNATGIEVEVIDGMEEARLSYLGMRNGLALDQELCLGCDIGGGSTEITIAKGDDIHFVSSLKLGAVTFTSRYLGSGEPNKSQLEDMRRQIIARLMPITRDVSRQKFTKAVASSGTAKALANIHSLMFKHGPLSDPNGYVIEADDLGQIVKTLTKLGDANKIKAQYNIDQNRAEIILAGAMILQSITDAFAIPRWHVSNYSLREGLVIDTYQRLHGPHAHADKDVRWRSVADFGRKFQVEVPYVEHVCDLAAQIYNQLAPTLCKDFDNDELISNPDILHAAAYLHEVGKIINHTSHHKHSYYILSHAGLLGFTLREKQLIALLVRYHRKSSPSDNDTEFGSVFHLNFARVNVLSGILRLATALDRTRRGRVQAVEVQVKKDEIIVSATGKDGEVPEAELMMAHRERKALSKAFDRKVQINAPFALE